MIYIMRLILLKCAVSLVFRNELNMKHFQQYHIDYIADVIMILLNEVLSLLAYERIIAQNHYVMLMML